MQFRLLFTFFLCAHFVAAQHTIRGTILDKKTREPIPYANIGISKANVGTISNPDGSFSIDIPKILEHDTLLFSALGFSRKSIHLSMLKGRSALTVYLPEKITWLATVTIGAKKEKNKIQVLGNRKVRGGVLEEDTAYSGRAIALLIGNKNQEFPLYVVKANLRIYRNNLKSLKFRVRLNAVDTLTGQPGDDLLQQSVVVESSMKNGWLEFDLSSLGVQVSRPFFVTFEQLLDLKGRTAVADGYRKLMHEHPEYLRRDTVERDGKKEVRLILRRGGLDLPGTFVGISSVPGEHTCFVRATSFGAWTKVRGIVSATVTTSNQPITPAKVDEEARCKKSPLDCEVEKQCQNFLDESSMNGLQLCVSVGGKVRLSKALGYADVKNSIQVTDSTRFRIGSISKAMTSLALIQLIAAGKLDPDAPIKRYIPGFPAKRFPITIRQLAGHLAGFRDYDANNLQDFIRTEHFDNATQALQVFENDSLLFQPGSRFNYSTFGWNLLGAIIESVSGEDYLGYMQKNIWRPLHLRNTCGDNIRASIPNRSRFYDIAGEENDFGDVSYKYPGGGLLSTCEDLVKIGNELLHGTFIAPHLKPLLFETQYTLDGKATGYGFGWYVGKDINGHRIWHHAGGSFSSSANLIIYPDDDLVIAFAGNSQDGVNFEIQKIAALFYKR